MTAGRPMADQAGDGRDRALLGLLTALAREGYRFVTPSNPTISVVRARPGKRWAQDLRDVFGWSLPFREGALADDMMQLMRTAGVLEAAPEGGWRSGLRVSSIDSSLFLHSAFPTSAMDAVFFGPDTYRYVAFLRQALPSNAPRLVVDIGAGSGAGGIVVGLLRPGARIALTDINRRALDLAGVNARAAGVSCACLEGSGLEPIEERPDLVIANPPFIAGRPGHLYQDGGDARGLALSTAWAEQAMRRLRPGGCMLLYTGSAIVGGRDPFQHRLAGLADQHGCRLDYAEMDPDICGDELDRPAYAEVERIAAVGAVVRKP
jgi:hypothetical protein